MATPRALSVLAALLTFADPALGCTSIMVGPDASKDGTAWVGQSDVGEGAGDARLVWVPPMDWPAGSKRPVIDYEDYPRYVGTERRVPAYYPSKQLPNKTANVIGYMPQVNHTFGFLEGDYALANEHGVSFGESTATSKTWTTPVSQGGPALLSMFELSRLAAERTKTARAAVVLMGAMAEQHGFWGDPSVDAGGESLLVTDGRESYIFHVIPADNKKGGAVWAAQRMPADHVTIVANAFVIGRIDPADPDTYLYSGNMHDIAKANGWWDGTGLLHWTQATA
jgi:dipeptidase